MHRTETSDQLITHGCGLDEVVATLTELQGKLQAPGQAAILRYQEGSDSESQYSTGTNSPDDQRSLLGTESPHEGSPFEELAEFRFSPVLPQIRSESPDSFLANIPTELHLLIFSHLDPLDSACLGLTNAHFYNLQKSFYGTIPLHAGRVGHIWELHRAQQQQQGGHCIHCGVQLCQLHMHLRDWMPPKYEYCAVRQIYSIRARQDGETDQEFCYRSNPLRPERCGRHPVGEVMFED